MSFDPNTFLNTTFEEVNDTKSVPVPAGEYLAISDKVEIKPWASKDGSSSGIKLEIVWDIQDDNVKALLGRDSVKCTQQQMLDLTDTGALDMGNGTVFVFAANAGAPVPVALVTDRWDWPSEGNESATRVRAFPATGASAPTTLFVTLLYPDGSLMPPVAGAGGAEATGLGAGAPKMDGWPVCLFQASHSRTSDIVKTTHSRVRRISVMERVPEQTTEKIRKTWRRAEAAPWTH
jgi:hypothetical protein